MATWSRACGVAGAVAAIAVAAALPAAACPKRHVARHRVAHHRHVARRVSPQHVAFHRSPRPAVRTVVVNHTVYVTGPERVVDHTVYVPGPERVVYRDREIVEPEVRFHVRRRAVVADREPLICPEPRREAIAFRVRRYSEPDFYVPSRHVRVWSEDYHRVRYRYRDRDCP
ncbi:MAG TPA: hypothetical protein VKT77_01190 [Chthonomonadaceae bacterium]|nr:hypothetical protein [Chthonomonadaceae bacterium]